MIQQLEKRPNKLADTSAPGYYMFNGGYNPITNVLADCPQASVVLLEGGTLRISGKVVFPYEKRILRDAVEGTKIPDPVPPAEFQDVPGTDPQVAPVRMTHKLPHESHAAPPPNVVAGPHPPPEPPLMSSDADDDVASQSTPATMTSPVPSLSGTSPHLSRSSMTPLSLQSPGKPWMTLPR